MQKSAIAENGNCYLYPADAGEGLLAACDIGTTTVVCHLLDGATDEVRLCTVSAPNAQRSFGADVISRIQASVDSGLDKLQSAIVDQINGIAGAIKTESWQNRRYPSAGGCRQHGHEPSVLRIVSGEYRCGTFYAFVSVWGKYNDAKQIGIEGCETVYVVPSIAGYVGGDIVADLAAVQMHSSVLAEDGEKETLLLDIGTNGEMVLGKSGSYVCCATAAGPAFEGAEIAMECRQLPEPSQKSGWKMEKSVASTHQRCTGSGNLRFRVDRRTGGIFGNRAVG